MMAVMLAPACQASADPDSPNNEPKRVQEQTLKQKSLDPTSDLKQFQVQNRFIPETHDADGYANLLNVRMWYPIPKSQTFPIRQVMRLTFPILTAPGGPTGLADIRFFDLFVPQEGRLAGNKWWRYALGPVFVFPTATDNELGSEKWQIGPAAGAILTAPKWQIALLVQNPISFAGDGDRDDVNRLIWQPIVVYWLQKGWYLGLQGTPKTVNWEDDGDAFIPLSGRVGRVIKFGPRSINLYLEPEYTLVHDDGPAPKWSIQIGLNFLFPL